MDRKMHQKLFKLPLKMLSLEPQDSNLYRNHKSMHFSSQNEMIKIMSISLVLDKIWNSQISCVRVNELSLEFDQVNLCCRH